jgi:BMFP domain-containing protein YqiC
MAQGGKIFDDLGRLMNDAAGVADGVRREVETVIRTQMERVTADMDLVKRDDFEALRELVRNQTDDIERLKAEIETLKSGGKSS